MEQQGSTLESMEMKGKKVLVTGGAGFVGGHLVERLIDEGAVVTVVDIVYDPKSYFKSKNLDKKTDSKVLDICDFEKLSELIRSNKIEIIFHLAAEALVENSYKNPRHALFNNIIGTINICEIARLENAIKAVVVASSDKAYGDLKKTKYQETDPLSGDHPYETSKSATDLISTTYYKTYGTPIVVTRFGNIYGEGDLNFSRILPGIMKALAQNDELKIRSDGKYIRDYLYVKDVVAGYIDLAKNINITKGEAFNFGSSDTLTVLQMIDTTEKALGKKVKYEIVNNAKNEIPYQSLDYGKISETIKWSPRYNLKKTLPDIYTWYREYFK